MLLLNAGDVVSVSFQLALLSLVGRLPCMALGLLSARGGRECCGLRLRSGFLLLASVLLFDKLDHLLLHLLESVHELLVLFFPA